MNTKKYFIDKSRFKLTGQREKNITQILSQNTKLIEECNLLRSENEKLRKMFKKVKKLLVEQIRRQKLLMKNKKNN